MPNFIRMMTITAGLIVVAATSAAQSAPSAKADLMRGVIERQVSLNSYVQVRASSEVIGLKGLEPATGNGADAGMEFENLGTFVDVRPFQNRIVISGGVYTGDRSRIDTATPSSAGMSDAGATLQPAGALKLAVTGDDFAPFVGLGYDSTYDSDRRWGVKLSAGALLSGSPEVAMTSRNGPLSGDAIFRDQLEKERQRFDEDTTRQGVHPVVQLGLSYRF